MKIIRPEYTPPKKEELIDDNTYKEVGRALDDYKKHIDENSTDFEKPTIIAFNVDDLMQQTINENKIKVEFYLTKKQYKMWHEKGAEKWLKKKLIGR